MEISVNCKPGNLERNEVFLVVGWVFLQVAMFFSFQNYIKCSEEKDKLREHRWKQKAFEIWKQPDFLCSSLAFEEKNISSCGLGKSHIFYFGSNQLSDVGFTKHWQPWVVISVANSLWKDADYQLLTDCGCSKKKYFSKKYFSLKKVCVLHFHDVWTPLKHLCSKQ